MTNLDKVFDIAINLMDEQDPVTGETNTADTEEYRYRALDIANVLCGELYPYSDTYEWPADGRRPVCPEVKDYEQWLPLDDVIARTVLPYGLAAHLHLGEDNDKASYFNQRYQELVFTLAQKRPAVWEDIQPMY